MKIKFIGHAAFYIESGDYRLLIDPFISNNPNSNIDKELLKDITHILITHGHGDHLGDAINIAKQCDATVICNFEIGNYLSSFNIKVHTMHIGGTYNFDFGRIKMTPALHGSGINHNGTMICGGNPCGYLIKSMNKTIYHAGDTGLTMDMKLLAIDDIDVAMLPIGGNYTMDIYDAIRAVDFIESKKVIPMHYNTFDVIKSDPVEFKKLIGSKSQVCILNPGEDIII